MVQTWGEAGRAPMAPHARPQEPPPDLTGAPRSGPSAQEGKGLEAVGAEWPAGLLSGARRGQLAVVAARARQVGFGGSEGPAPVSAGGRFIAKRRPALGPRRRHLFPGHRRPSPGPGARSRTPPRGLELGARRASTLQPGVEETRLRG